MSQEVMKQQTVCNMRAHTWVKTYVDDGCTFKNEYNCTKCGYILAKRPCPSRTHDWALDGPRIVDFRRYNPEEIGVFYTPICLKCSLQLEDIQVLDWFTYDSTKPTNSELRMVAKKMLDLIVYE